MLFWRNRHDVSDEELNAFVDGELEESSRGRVERHMESCTSCSETVTELRAVSRAMSELPSVRAPRSFALREADVKPASVSVGAGLFGSATPLLSGVAAIAIVAFVVLAGFDITSDSSQSDSSNALRAGQAQSLEIVAADERDPGDGAVAPAEGEEFAAQLPDSDAFGAGYLSYDVESTNGGERDPEPGMLSDDKEEEPLTREALDGASIAPALADDDGDDTGLRVAESVAAAVAIAAGGSVLLIWWRRRATAV